MDQDDFDDFPVLELDEFHTLVSGPRWISPILPRGVLEILLEAAFDFCNRGVAWKSKACQQFIQQLPMFFSRLLKAEVISSLTPEMHECVYRSAQKFVDLCIGQIRLGEFELLEMMAILFDPMNKFHTINASRVPETYNPETPPPDDQLFAIPIEKQNPKGWLVDLINRFGTRSGFAALIARVFFTDDTPLSIYSAHAILKPFANCIQFLTKVTVEKYLFGMHVKTFQTLYDFSCNNDTIETADVKVISDIIKYLKSIEQRVPDTKERYMNVEIITSTLSSRMMQASASPIEKPLDNAKEKTLQPTNKLLEELVKNEDTITFLANAKREEMKKNAELLKRLSTSTEKNRLLEERVKYLENKYELDLKEVPSLKETIQKLTTKLNEIQPIEQKCYLDIQGVVFPTTWTASTANKKYEASSRQTDRENEYEEENNSPVEEEIVKPESPVASSSSSTCPYFDYFKFFEENKNNLAVKILEKLSTRHLVDVRLVSKKFNELMVPILHRNRNLILDFSYNKQQNVHPLSCDLSLQKSFRRTLCQFNKVLQSATIIAEKCILDNSSSAWKIPCSCFSFDLINLSKTDFNKGALFKFFTSYLNNFSSLKQLTLTESDRYLNSKVQQEHHEIIVKILKKSCYKIENLDISGLYSVSNRSGIEISSSCPEQYFSKLETLKTNGNLVAVNEWIISSATILKSVELSDYRSLESLKVFEKHVCLGLIQKLEVKIPTILSLSQLDALQKLDIFRLDNLKSIKVWAEDGRQQGKANVTNKNIKEIVPTEIPSIIARMLKTVEKKLEILESGDSPFCCKCHPVEYPEFSKLHTLRYVDEAGLLGVGFLGNALEFDGKFQALTTVIFDLNYVSDDWFDFFCQGGTIPSVQSLEISNESFIRKESDQNLGNIAAAFPNLKRCKICDLHRVLTQTCFLKSIWKHLRKLERLEVTLGKRAASNQPAHTVDSIITGLSLSTCSLMYDSTSIPSFTNSLKEPSILDLQDLKRFTLHLGDLSSLICRNKDYPLLSKVTGQFVSQLMPKLRVQIFVPTSLLEKARETSIYPFVTFVGEE